MMSAARARAHKAARKTSQPVFQKSGTPAGQVAGYGINGGQSRSMIFGGAGNSEPSLILQRLIPAGATPQRAIVFANERPIDRVDARHGASARKIRHSEPGSGARYETLWRRHTSLACEKEQSAAWF